MQKQRASAKDFVGEIKKNSAKLYKIYNSPAIIQNFMH